MNRENQNSLVLAILTVGVVGVALVAACAKWATWLEAFSFVTGAVCVWLVVRENVWNFPMGLANVTAYAIVFFEAKLYADAGLQLVYFVLGLAGWVMWSRTGDRSHSIPIVKASRAELITVLVFCFLSTAGLWTMLYHVGGSASFWDALTTSVSLGAQWLLTRKRLENWLGWILVDIVYVPLYVYKELYLTAILYAVFLCMAIIGWIEWRRVWHRSGGGSPGGEPGAWHLPREATVAS
ncbi:MAG: nicotinamide riboside transporter PnuC [Pirellula sp.]